ncbi:hypothetical protein FBZ89_13248 [Nitrospirillum amazonense]|uniref:Uncharacterized protein n=1 Tax=Nitrospirillum amazonense TaxID=28077 RepID=A0A560EN28_9PROT|nr:hypothetical protein FBZ89_13248 [Nitrospirillum amazonense]
MGVTAGQYSFNAGPVPVIPLSPAPFYYGSGFWE